MGGKKKKEEGEHRCKMERAKLVRSRVKAREPEGWDMASAGQTAHYAAIAHELDNSDLDGSTLYVHPASSYLQQDKEW